MVPITSLWMPILLSAVVVFLASSVIHMVLKYHKTDWHKAPNEDAILGAIRSANTPPGDYVLPAHESAAAMRDPAFQAKMSAGPMAMLTVIPPGPVAMGKNLAQWFAFSVLVGIFTAYITGRALGPGADYMDVFRMAGTTAFVGYSLALLHDSIWYGRKWSTTLKFVVDGLIFGLLTAGVFGWRWPGA